MGIPPQSYGTPLAVRAHSVTCHPTQLNAPRLTPARQTGTQPQKVGRLTWPRQLATYTNMVYLPSEVFTHPSTNRAQRRANTLIKTNALPLSQATANMRHWIVSEMTYNMLSGMLIPACCHWSWNPSIVYLGQSLAVKCNIENIVLLFNLMLICWWRRVMRSRKMTRIKLLLQPQRFNYITLFICR